MNLIDKVYIDKVFVLKYLPHHELTFFLVSLAIDSTEVRGIEFKKFHKKLQRTDLCYGFCSLGELCFASCETISVVIRRHFLTKTFD